MIVRVKLSLGKKPEYRSGGEDQGPEERLGEMTLASGGVLPDRAGERAGLQTVPVEEAKLRPESRLVVHSHPGSLGADRFRFLRMVLRQCWSTGKMKRLLVTSPLPHDGKSTTAANLATTLAERGKRSVLLVEADLYAPSLCSLLGLSARPGLGEVLEGTLDPLSALRRIEPLGYYLLSAGIRRREASELVHSDAFAETMHNLSPHFDWVVIDAPPVIPVSDVLSLRSLTDGSLLVVKVGSTPDDAIEQAISVLGQKHVLSIVLNGMDRLERLYSRYDKYYGKSGTSSIEIEASTTVY